MVFSFLEFFLDLNDKKLFLLCMLLLLNYFSYIYIYIHIYNNSYILLTEKIFYSFSFYVLVAFLVIFLFFSF